MMLVTDGSQRAGGPASGNSMSFSADIPCPHPGHQLPDAFFIGFNSILKNPEAILKNSLSRPEILFCCGEKGVPSPTLSFLHTKPDGNAQDRRRACISPLKI